MSSAYFAIWSRDPQSSDVSGRMHILRAVRDVMLSRGWPREQILLPIFARQGRTRGMLIFALTLAGGLARLRPLPLQCALYAIPGEVPVDFRPHAGEVILFDSLRPLLLMEKLRQNWPDVCIVVDMDDLMSRRTSCLIDNGFDVSLGLIAEQMPSAFSRLLRWRLLSRLLLRYEHWALLRTEVRICSLADEVVMVSQIEAQILSKMVGPGARARIRSVTPPAASPVGQAVNFTADADKGRLRFVFVGSDKLVQNQTGIDWLIMQWREHRPIAELVIFGRQSRRYSDLPPNVRVHGFVETIAEVYDGNSVLFCPTFLAGGVKTKMLEAFCYGAPVIGTALTYEGIEGDPAFLKIEEIDMARLYRDPESYRGQLADLARGGQQRISKRYGAKAFRRKWEDIFLDVENKKKK